MARPNRRRSVEGERNLSLRIQREREYRGLSYDALAKAMSAAGCSIQGSAIFKIEKGEPPRRITVDELVALAAVFDLEIEDLLTPVEVLRTQRAKEVLKEIDAADEAFLDAAVELVNRYTEYFDLAAYEPDMREYIDNHRFAQGVADDRAQSIPPLEIQVDGSPLFDLDGTAFMTALRDFYLAVIALADTAASAAVRVNNERGIRVEHPEA